MVQDLGKELKFGGETDVPSSHCIEMVGPLGSEQLVSTPEVKGSGRSDARRRVSSSSVRWAWARQSDSFDL